ncbi:DUF1616 domain-containing protein [Dehalococcoidales bacterium]|nr:DUF1616 domain-containing protein [Dehalococcoidales bacterium]
MGIKIRNELLPLNLLVLLLIAAILFFPYDALRIAIGIPFVLFFPGYTLLAALFPRRDEISIIERLALSFGLSLAVVPLIGLILNYTPWGIRLESILWSIASFIFIMSAIAWFRRKRLPSEERFGIEFQLALPGWGGGAWDKVLSITLVIAILGALGMLGYVIATPKVGEKFTEFYILGLEGKAVDYPRELRVGEEGRVIVGIINNEHRIVNYRVEVRINGVRNSEIGPVVLEHDKKWEGEVSFTPEVAGKEQKVEFLLFKDEKAEPYLKLHLWIDVSE